MSTSIIAPQPQGQHQTMATIRRKGSLSKLFSFAALDDEVSTTGNDDSATTSMSTTLLRTRNHRSPTIDLSLDTPDKDLITAKTVVEDKELFAEFQSKLRDSQAVGTSMSAGAILNKFIKEKNGNILDRRQAPSVSNSSSDPSKSSDASTPNQELEQHSSGLVKAAADTTESAKRLIRRASSRMSVSLLQSLDDESLFGYDDEEEDGPLILQRRLRIIAQHPCQYLH